MTAVAVSAENVTYAARGKALVAGVSITLRRGELTAMIGPNGAGKSTLLRILAGELVPSEGRVSYARTDIQLLAPWQLATCRVVMAQATHLAFPFSTWEVAALGVESLGRKLPREKRRELIHTALEKAEVAHLAERIYQTLSGGEQQRVQFARALTQLLAWQPEIGSQVLFLDEPTAHLDMSHQLMLLDEARRRASDGVAIFVTIHDLNLAAAYADRLAVMNRGYVVAHGNPAEVLTDDLVATVFGLDSKVGEIVPAADTFILPHGHVARQRARLKSGSAS